MKRLLRAGMSIALWAFVAVAAYDGVPKLLYLIVEEDRIVASNVQFSRFDELQLNAKEVVEKTQVGKAVAVVVTNQRFLAYGALAPGWQSLRVLAEEKPLRVEAEDFSATIVTSDRLLNFNGRRGIWVQTKR